jgi:AmmeMemoRadiSam system protein A
MSSRHATAGVLTGDLGAALLALARRVIHERLGADPPAVPEHPLLWQHRAGAFVTVNVEGSLRGCIGIPDPAEAIGEVVRHCAAAAAFDDPRFPPVRRDELTRLTLEVSVLSEFVPVEDFGAIEIGRHGLVVERGRRRGLLLPQVAPEYGWTVEEFLRNACIKAGLPPSAWQSDARILRFEAIVFRE